MSAAGTPKASEAAVAAVQDALGCEEESGDLEFQTNPSYCTEHHDSHGDFVLWSERGCPVAVAAADAAAPHNAAQTLRDYGLRRHAARLEAGQ